MKKVRNIALAIIIAGLAIGIFPVEKAHAAAIASTANGVWSAGATWTGGVPPAEGDTCQISHDVTLDTSVTVGADSATPAIDILSGGKLDWDNLGDDTLRVKGDFYIRDNGALILDGTTNKANRLVIELNYSASPALKKYGLINEYEAEFQTDGYHRTNHRDILSANAASGQKVIVTTIDHSADWEVGDTVVIGDQQNIGTGFGEVDTIASFAGTSITLTNNLAQSHLSTDIIVCLDHNIKFTTYNESYALRGYISMLRNYTLTDVTFQYTEFSYLKGPYWTRASPYKYYGTCNYCSFDYFEDALDWMALPSQDNTMTGVVLSRKQDTGGSMFTYEQVTYTDCVAIKGASGNGGTGSERRRYINSWFANNYYGIWYEYSSLGDWDRTLIQDSVFHGNNDGYFGAMKDSEWDNNTFIGNDNDFNLGTSAGKFEVHDCTFANTNSFNLVYAGMIRFFGLNNSPTELSQSATDFSGFSSFVSFSGSGTHITYKPAGSYEKQNTVVRSGNYALGAYPTDANNELVISSTIPAQANSAISIIAWFRKDVDYDPTHLPYIRISGVGMTADTDTMTDIDDTWEELTVSGVPTTDGFARIDFVCQSGAAGGEVYIDDIEAVHASIDTGTMDYWFEGDAPSVLMSTDVGAIDIWDVDTGLVGGSGTMGELFLDWGDNMIFIALFLLCGILSFLSLRSKTFLLAIAAGGAWLAMMVYVEANPPGELSRGDPAHVMLFLALMAAAIAIPMVSIARHLSNDRKGIVTSEEGEEEPSSPNFIQRLAGQDDRSESDEEYRARVHRVYTKNKRKR